MVLHVRGVVLPEREERSVWIDGGVLRADPVAGADTVIDGGWLLPGLVDVHTHPGAWNRPAACSTRRSCATTWPGTRPPGCC